MRPKAPAAAAHRPGLFFCRLTAASQNRSADGFPRRRQLTDNGGRTTIVYDPHAQNLTDESGATAIEYAIIAGGIASAIIATVYSIGPKLNTIFTSTASRSGLISKRCWGRSIIVLLLLLAYYYYY